MKTNKKNETKKKALRKVSASKEIPLPTDPNIELRNFLIEWLVKNYANELIEKLDGSSLLDDWFYERAREKDYEYVGYYRYSCNCAHEY